jgi:putative ABC transport system permease protein
MGRRIFALLLKFLPGDFRSEFADAITADVDRADTRWWTKEIPGLIGAAAREHCGGVMRDLVDTWRLLRRTPGFTFASIVMLAAGTGATAAVFSVVDAVILRPAFPNPAAVVTVAEIRESGSIARSVTIDQFRRLSARPEFSSVAGLTGHIQYVDYGGRVGRVDLECVSHSLFDVTGMHPMIGRGFDAAEDRAGAAPVVVIGERMWRRDFGGRPEAIGETMSFGAKRATVIGVMPAEFLGALPNNNNEAWAPLEPAIAGQADALCGGMKRVEVVARLRTPLAGSTAGASFTDGATRFGLARADAETLDGYGTPLIALMATAACVLLIACANVANLQLERLAGRRQELAVRMALGASRWRVVRQALVENVAIGLAGATVGVFIARSTLGLLVRLAPPQLPHVGEIGIDMRALGVAIAAAIACGLALGLVPLLQLRHDGTGGLRSSHRTVKGGGLWIRRALIVGEVALSCALVVAATLMARSFIALRPAELGFTPNGRIIAEASVDDETLTQAARAAFARDVTDRLRRLPGVRSAAASSYLPLLGYTESAPVAVGEHTATAWTGWFTPAFPDSLGATLVTGRQFTDADTADSAPVGIVNATLARAFFGSESAIGRTIDVTHGRTVTPRRIVGVIGDMREGGRDRIQRPELYAPITQQPDVYLLYFVVNTTGAVLPTLNDDIRAAVKSARPGQLLHLLEPMAGIVTRGFSRARFGVWLFGVLAALALGLAGLGLGAVIAWWVRDRRAEIGVRIALGAPTERVAGRVVAESVAVAGTGAVLGLGAAFAGARLLADWLFDVPPHDALTFAIGGAIMLGIAAAAAYIPARRAARIDPAIALRTE